MTSPELLARRALADHTAASHAAAERVIAHYSTSFGAASRLLGHPVRQRVRSLYALVRVADEVVDGAAAGAGLGVDAVADALDEHEHRTLRALGCGYSTDPVVHAFADAARATGIGADLVRPFYASMRADLHVAAHDDASLAQYVHGSAEVVGLMCVRVFTTDGAPAPVVPAPHLEEGARRLGAAFQQVNFLRDLAEDTDGRGRTYLPGAGAVFTDADRDAAVARVRADLAAAEAVIDGLPGSSRAAVRACHDLYAALTDRIAATPAAELRRRRVRVPDAVKAGIVARAALRERVRR
ncbi:phytoene synthase [Kytococcus schroeteri]|uniref:Phytoene synthase n=1 Tax=Kytococcus schroeteri TaxID=138300 RepID=A0A2I1PDX5_9MICO|nr:squalene/phytoene synthase family protein [Kytococcus schroeteri]PKZ42819.1 phytoene synthase [Kytococcus schroeteri]